MKLYERMNEMKSNRNGTIEIMRFVFSVIIIFFHLNNRLPVVYFEHFTFFRHGKIGVEFFFLVSGYLLAKAAHRQYSSENLAGSTAGFIYKKFMGIFPYHLIVFFADLIIFYVMGTWKGIIQALEDFVSILPGLFFLQKSGIKCTEINTIEWYIPAMLIAMTVLYPLVLKFKNSFTKIACPIIMITVIGYLIHSTGELGGVNQFVFNNTLPKVYVRAFAEMCGGVFLYEVVQHFKNYNPGKVQKALLSAVELCCYAAPLAYTVTNAGNEYEAHAFYSLAIAVGLSFSGKTYSVSVFNNKVVYFLGKLSLPIYLAQSIALDIFDRCGALKNARHLYQIVFLFGATMIFALITMFAGDKLKKLFVKPAKD